MEIGRENCPTLLAFPMAAKSDLLDGLAHSRPMLL